MDNHRDDAADVLVIFGITGDLARRMTFRALYRLERRGLLDCPIIGVASDDINTEQLVKHAREARFRGRGPRQVLRLRRRAPRRGPEPPAAGAGPGRHGPAGRR
jgi:hypothetical protein